MKTKNKQAASLGVPILPYTLYPKEYGFTLISTLFFFSLVTSSIYFFVNSNKRSIYDFIPFTISVIAMGLFVVYLIAVSFSLIAKRIFIEVSKEDFRLKGVIKTKSVSINDIDTISKIQGIKGGKCFALECTGSEKLAIPNYWFSEKEMMELFYLLMANNPRINLNVGSF